MPEPGYAAYAPVKPYFDLVRGAVGALADGDHFFDAISDDMIYEVLYEIPGWPRVISGRAALMAAFVGYAANIRLRSADNLIVHNTNNGLIIEYEVHGTILASGARYDNRFCSIIRIEHRKITHWRDYMDSLTAWNALTGPRTHT
jgi:ketosteroid isomerase-like protein